MTQQQFLRDQARLDGFPQSDVIGQQQVHPRRFDRSGYRFELVVLNGHPRAERGLQGLDIRRGHCRPAHRVEEGGKLIPR